MPTAYYYRYYLQLLIYGNNGVRKMSEWLKMSALARNLRRVSSFLDLRRMEENGRFLNSDLHNERAPARYLFFDMHYVHAFLCLIRISFASSNTYLQFAIDGHASRFTGIVYPIIFV